MRLGRTGIVEHRFALRGLEQPLTMLHEAVATFADMAALAPSSRSDLELLLEVLVTTIVSHGYGTGRAGSVHIRMHCSGKIVRITVCDRAPAFDPLSHRPDEDPAMLEEADVGGAGIALVRRLTSDPRYVRVAGRNLLTMKLRNRTGKAEPACPPTTAPSCRGAGSRP